VRFYHLQNVGGEPSGDTHFLDFFRGFDCSCHKIPYPPRRAGVKPACDS
jgi:hypothetical protein